MSLRDLDNIDLAESWVLGVSVGPRFLKLEFDFVLLPGHPAYRKSRSGEAESFRKGTLAFDQLRRLTWSSSGQEPVRDASGELDWDHPVVHTVTKTSAHIISELGDMQIEYRGRLIVRLHEEVSDESNG